MPLAAACASRRAPPALTSVTPASDRESRLYTATPEAASVVAMTAVVPGIVLGVEGKPSATQPNWSGMDTAKDAEVSASHIAMSTVLSRHTCELSHLDIHGSAAIHAHGMASPPTRKRTP